MKLLRTNTNEYKNNFKTILNDYLLNYGDNYCENINDLLLCFNNEYNYENNKKRYPNLQTRLKEYLQGTPYGFGFAYKDEILSFAAEVHKIEKIPTNKEDIIISNFYNHCAAMILRIANKQTVKELY